MSTLTLPPTDITPPEVSPIHSTHHLPLPAAPLPQLPCDAFTIRHPFIYSSSFTPTYHIQSLLNNEGQPWQLQFSRLLPSESRRLSEPAARSAVSLSRSNFNDPDPQDTLQQPFRVRYDEDLTLYLTRKVRVPFSIGSKTLLCMRGCKKSTLRGTIVLERAGHYSSTLNFLHLTPIRRDIGDVENRRMQELINRRGYKASDDWREKLLFSIKALPKAKNDKTDRLQWTDVDNAVVALEDADGLQIVQQLDPQTKELLVACWLSKSWVQAKPNEETVPM